MFENDEQIDKEIVWQSHIQNAKDRLIELEKAKIKFNEGQNQTKEKIIKELAQALEDNGMLTGLISEEIIRALEDEGYGITRQYINRCLESKYKTKLCDNVLEEPETSFQNDGKNVPEQKTMTVDTQGYEAYEDTDRGPNVRPASEVELLKKLADVTSERDDLSNENKIIKEKTQPELLHELEEKFYDQPGMLDAKQLQKISEKAGRDLETIVSRYNTIIQNAVDKGGPVPLGTYIITKPDMKLVPVRIFINFVKKKIVVSLWEKKLT